MSDATDAKKSDRGVKVERGEKYDHSKHGRVKVTGIWKGARQVDRARNTDETGVTIVRYSIEREVTDVNEFTDTLDDFVAAIDGSAPA